MSIWLTSDWHFGHDREFIYKPRGFETLANMENTIIENYNRVVTDEDDVYVLGDLMLGDNSKGIEKISKLKGKLHIIYGNHDTPARMALYKKLPNVVELVYATSFKYKKYIFYCSHYPTYTGNLEVENLHKTILNLFGHTHSKTLFYNDIPFMYNVSVDAHNCNLVSVDTVIEDIKNKVIECQCFLGIKNKDDE